MLDCKMNSSLSPATPTNILSDCYGMWDQEALNPMETKILSTDMLELMDSSLSSPTTTPASGGLLLNHNGSIRDCHFQSSQYLTPLPSFGSDPYATPECQMLDSLASIDSTFHKFSEACSSFSDNYENYIPDLTPTHLMHSQGSHHGQGQHQCQPENVGGLTHPIHTHGSFGIHEPNFTPHLYSAHHEYMCDDFGCDPGEYFYLRKGESPTTSDSISYRDIDSEVDSKSSGESLETLKTRLEIRPISPPKRRVGRPPKKDKKLKRLEKRTGRLWEFIRDLLKNPEYCPSLVRWENPDEGHFRFVNSEKVAQLWGQIKGNPRMTYEKLSRAMSVGIVNQKRWNCNIYKKGKITPIAHGWSTETFQREMRAVIEQKRYYYKSHVFEPVLGRRLVYKFGCNAVNWRPVNPNFVQKLYN